MNQNNNVYNPFKQVDQEQINKESKRKQTRLMIIGVLILVIGLIGVTYAFFNYTRTGSANTIRTGRIAFNSEQGQAINLTNVFPIDVTNGIPNNNANVGSVTIQVTGDTTYTEGIEYLVTATNVQNTIGSGANQKTLPISIDVSVSDNTHGEAPNQTTTTLGTEDDSYFTNRGASSQTSIYKVLAGETISTDDQLLVGYIKSGLEGIDGNIVIKAYIDKAKVGISDTYPEEETDTNNDGYLDGTENTFGTNREIFTTTEWNSLQQDGVSFQIKVEAQEGTWVPEPPVQYAQGIKCQRVTSTAKLHTETCTQTSNNCYADGYTGNNTTITYGNLGTTGTLAAGDAFDCDVNGDGIVNEDTNGNSIERFYYVSPYYNTNTQTFDNTTATLIYYSNTYNSGSSVVISTNGAAYYASANENWHGPVTAITHLPTTTQWSNIQLKTTSRTILACSDADCTTSVLTTANGNETISNPFNYTGKAARLLTVQELANGCKAINNNTPLSSTGALTVCNFLFEGTKYADSSKAINGSWLETPRASNSGLVWIAGADYRYVSRSDANGANSGARPAIDVAISDIEY